MSKFPAISIPQQDDFENPAVELDYQRIRQELAQLPVLNLRSSIKTVIDGVKPGNTQNIPPRLRLQLLEVYRDTVASLYPAIEDAPLRKLPLSKREREDIRTSTAEMLRQLGNGYKVLLKQAHDTDNTGLKAVAAFRALEVLSLALLHSFRCYASPPPGTLRELHQIYLYARIAGLDESIIMHEKTRLSEKTTGLLYRQIMLLAVCDPYHFPVNAASHMYAFLEPYAQLCTLAANDENMKQDQFLIDLETDNFPWPLTRGLPEQKSLYLLLFDIQPGLQEAARRIQAKSNQTDGDRLETRLEKLLAGRFNLLKRQHKRTPTRYSTNLVAGIDTIHRYLSDGTAQLGSKIRDIENAIMHGQYNEADPHEIERWEIINESLKGLCLKSPATNHSHAQVGEVLGIINKSAGGSPHFLLATVQWLRNTSDSRQAGVELIPGKTTQAECTPDDNKKIEYHVLVISAVESLGTPAAIIAPRNLFHPDRILHIHSPQGKQTIRCENIIKESPCLEYFSYKIL